MIIAFIGNLFVVFEDGQAIAFFTSKKEAVRYVEQASWIAQRA